VLPGGDDLDILDPRGSQTFSHKRRGRIDIGSMLRESADAGDAEELFQFLQQTLFVRFDKAIGGGGHAFS
jgi:hypothetical protein